MSASTQPQTFADLYTSLLNKTRNDTSAGSTLNQAKGAICTALYDMHLGYGEKFQWCERSAQLLTQAQYSTGTVSISQGSNSLAGVSSLWNTNNAFSAKAMRAGGKIVINGTPEIYEISAVGTDTAATLTSKYVGSDVSAGGYVYFEDEYALATDFLRPLDIESFSGPFSIDLIGRREFRQRYPRNNNPGRPRVATLLDKAPIGNATPVRHVAFHQPPDQAYLIPYSYVTSNLAVTAAGAAQANLVNDTDEPIVPIGYRHGIVLHALYNWYRDKKGDPRSQETKAEWTDFMLRVTSDLEIGHSRPQFRPRVGPYTAAARRPYRGGRAGRHTLGSSFDEMR